MTLHEKCCCWICPQKGRWKIIDWVVSPIVPSVQRWIKNWVVRPICTEWENVWSRWENMSRSRTFVPRNYSLPNPNIPTLLTCLYIHAPFTVPTRWTSSHTTLSKKCLKRNVFHKCFTWNWENENNRNGEELLVMIIVYYVS